MRAQVLAHKAGALNNIAGTSRFLVPSLRVSAQKLLQAIDIRLRLVECSPAKSMQLLLLAIVDLRLFARFGDEHGMPIATNMLPNTRCEATHARVARAESVVVDEILDEHHRVATALDRDDDQLALLLAPHSRAGSRPDGRTQTESVIA